MTVRNGERLSPTYEIFDLDGDEYEDDLDDEDDDDEREAKRKSDFQAKVWRNAFLSEEKLASRAEGGYFGL